MPCGGISTIHVGRLKVLSKNVWHYFAVVVDCARVDSLTQSRFFFTTTMVA